MENKIEYCFVVDKNNRPLAPTKVNKGWYFIRKGRAKLKSKYPMVIQLEKEVEPDDEDEIHVIVGIDRTYFLWSIGLSAHLCTEWQGEPDGLEGL